ncbi:transcriptional regulator TbsP domain-containing protein [Halorubrum sp. HHNYT27]|uniref:transcriptional regulator TbsP domain-containing protein n=1 Tax=Halorubrum sp. HHNYT27 TaxID=3402275 RepID=UPI003EC1384B
MSPDPTLPFAVGPRSIRALVDPVLVDPSPPLLLAMIEAYHEAAPGLVDPEPSTLHAEVSDRDSSVVASDPSTSNLPPLTVLASDHAVDTITEEFHSASRLAALTEPGVWDLLRLSEPQPNAVLASRTTGWVLVPVGGREDDGDADADRIGQWRRIGDDPTLRDRHAPVVEAAAERRLRSPSRRRVYESLRTRCGVAVADDVLRALDGERGRSGDDSLDLAGARRRAYVVGAHRGALDHDLRRACEDAGLGSSATFTSIKRTLREAGLLDTESVSQPVGRSRDRLVARGALAEADSPTAAVAAALDAVE